MAAKSTKQGKQGQQGQQTQKHNEKPNKERDDEKTIAPAREGVRKAAQLAVDATDPEFVHGVACGDLSQLTKLCQSRAGWSQKCQEQSRRAAREDRERNNSNSLRPGR